MANENYFTGNNAKGTYLRARGFDESGMRSGGIKSPKLVTIASGSVLVRLYHQPGCEYGEWWSTPTDLKTIQSYFARGVSSFTEGRSTGKGALHAALGIRHDWSNNDPRHLGLFWAVSTNYSLQAYFGEGDDASDSKNISMQKVALVIDGGRQRRIRQIFLPEPWTYPAAFARIGGGTTGSALFNFLRGYKGVPLPFER